MTVSFAFDLRARYSEYFLEIDCSHYPRIIQDGTAQYIAVDILFKYITAHTI